MITAGMCLKVVNTPCFLPPLRRFGVWKVSAGWELCSSSAGPPSLVNKNCLSFGGRMINSFLNNVQHFQARAGISPPLSLS